MLHRWSLSVAWLAAVFCADIAAREQPVRPLPAPVAAVASTGAEQAIRGKLVARRFTTLAAQRAARVNRLAGRAGERIEAGALLAELDCADRRALLEQARTGQEMAQRTHASLERRLAQGALSAMALERSAAEVARAAAEVAYWQAVLGHCRIHAPFGGRIAAVRVAEDQYVEVGQPLLELVDDSELELEFVVPSKWLLWLANGLQVQVTIDETGKTYPAAVARIGARVDAASQSIKVLARLEGSFPELIADMGASVRITPPR